MIGNDNPEAARQYLHQVSVVIRPSGITVHQHYRRALAFIQIMEAAMGKRKVMGTEAVVVIHAQEPFHKGLGSSGRTGPRCQRTIINR